LYAFLICLLRPSERNPYTEVTQNKKELFDS